MRRWRDLGADEQIALGDPQHRSAGRRPLQAHLDFLPIVVGQAAVEEIGGIARLFVRGRSGIGLTATILYGIAGSLLGGVIANGWLDLGGVGQFLTAIACAAILVIVTRPATR